MSSIYELYGKQAEELATVKEGFEDYFKQTQELLNKLVSGDVEVAQLEVNKAGWNVNSYNHSQAGTGRREENRDSLPAGDEKQPTPLFPEKEGG